MRLEIDVTLDYSLHAGETVLLTLEAAQTTGQHVHDSHVTLDGAALHRITGEDGRGSRIWASIAGDRMTLHYRAIAEVTRTTPALGQLAATRLSQLPASALSYLRPSRFCQSDLFTDFVEQRFGHLSGGARIAAMRDWVVSEIVYRPGSSGATTTAIDSFVARRGVCRDQAHLLCSMARAGDIPARYVATYGLAVDPPDFHAVVEVWLDGAWHLVDPSGMCDANGLVVIASGRDAADVAFMETAKDACPMRQSVQVWEI